MKGVSLHSMIHSESADGSILDERSLLCHVSAEWLKSSRVQASALGRAVEVLGEVRRGHVPSVAGGKERAGPTPEHASLAGHELVDVADEVTVFVLEHVSGHRVKTLAGALSVRRVGADVEELTLHLRYG